ncbi:MAG: hypothetical protein NVS2B6_10670 [Thermoleophilaceae bacterium]
MRLPQPSNVVVALGAGSLLGVLLTLALVTDSGRSIVSATMSGDGRRLRDLLLGLGLAGAIILLAVILSHAIVPFPMELVTGAAGFVYGFELALPVVLAFWLSSALLSYWLAERLGRPLARRLIGSERLARGEQLVARGGAGALLSVRLIPLVPFNAICYAAGIARVPLLRYTWTTLAGMAPLTILVTYLGSRLEAPRFDDPRLLGAIAGLIALVLGGQMLMRRIGRGDG